MEKGTILVVEDEANIADLVELYLAREGFRVLQAARPATGALDAVRDHRPRLVVLDVGLPDIDGLEVCRRIRAVGQPARDLPHRPRRRGRPRARPRARGRRLPHQAVLPRRARRPGEGGPAPGRRRRRRPRSCRPAGSTIDVGRREIRIDDAPVDFTTKEFDLLRFLAERPGLALSRQQILDGVWGYDWFGDVRTVDVHIAQVRKKLGDACTITTVRGVGYRMDSSAPRRGRRDPARRDAAHAARPRDGRDRDRRARHHRGRHHRARPAQRGRRPRSSSSRTKAPRVARQLEALGASAAHPPGSGARTAGTLSRLVVSTLRISNGGLVTVTPDGEVTDGAASG